jgi:predicted DNA-binding helix-hairpin-helix protein
MVGRPIVGKEKGGEEGKGDRLGQCWAWPTRERTQISYFLLPKSVTIYVCVYICLYVLNDVSSNILV